MQNPQDWLLWLALVAVMVIASVVFHPKFPPNQVFKPSIVQAGFNR